MHVSVRNDKKQTKEAISQREHEDSETSKNNGNDSHLSYPLLQLALFMLEIYPGRKKTTESHTMSLLFTRSFLHYNKIATNGIVIATEKKAVSTLIDDSSLEKVAIICSNIGMVYSGMGPDYRVLVNKARKAAQAYKRVYMEEPPTAILVKEIASVMQEFTQSG